MSLTLGEKLRQARDERGISISEVAEQTRISPMYLELIENDDYSTLPGGIFNKGFVKSYAKYVGIDEQEALQDYAAIVAGDDAQSDEPRNYRPEVLTDDRTSSSMIPTIIFAVIILGLMTWGILALVNYIQNNPSTPPPANAGGNSNGNANTAANPAAPPSTNAPAMGAVKIEFKTTGEDIAFSANIDGKTSYPTATLSAPVVLEPKESLEISYLKLKSAVARLTINGKEIPLPTEATDPKGKYIQVRINAETLPQMWQSGTTVAAAPAPNTNTNAAPVTAPVNTPAAPVVRTTPKPAASATPVVKTSPPPANTGTTAKPGGTPRKPNE